MDKWHKRFIELAKTIAQYSKDPRTKVGAVIVDDEKESFLWDIMVFQEKF